MASVKMFTCLFFVLLINYPGSLGVPTGSDPASAAVDPSAAPVAAPVAAPPVESSVPAASAPAAGSPQNPNGIITEHKNPDGSTITVTRFNGPLPASVFQSPFQSDFTRLHDVVLQNNLYQAQLIQLQTQQVINQALLRNMQLFGYPTIPTFPYIFPNAGQFLNPFAPFGGFGYPSFYPGYGGQAPAARSNK